MIKKLDTLILKAFIGPFIATFFISLFILVLQFFWKYIDDLVGKGLDTFTLLQLTTYVTATAVPLALPLGILISSIMTFGKLGESFETVAIKSAGIPLLRFMRPLMIVAVMVCGVAFLFSNYVIPVAQLKFQTLLYDITVAKPAFNLKEGVFFKDFEGYTIKIGKKEKDNITIHDVIIFERNYNLQDNIIVAERGKMNISDDKKFLEFHLENGWRHEERGPSYSINTEYIRLNFENYKKVFDLSDFTMMKTPDSLFKDNYRMLNMRQLDKTIDSLEVKSVAEVGRKIDREIGINYDFVRKKITPPKVETPPVATITSVEIKRGVKPVIPKPPVAGSQRNDFVKAMARPRAVGYEDLLPDSTRQQAISRAIDRINSQKSSIVSIVDESQYKVKSLRNHLVEWHRKLSLSFACVVLFLIGAPLGSIIRKGGMGMPLVIAVIFFLIFHLLNMFGEKFVREGFTVAFVGMWLSTLVLLPIGFFLTYKAMHDSQLFNKEFYYRLFRPVSRFIKKMRKPSKEKLEVVPAN